MVYFVSVSGRRPTYRNSAVILTATAFSASFFAPPSSSIYHPRPPYIFHFLSPCKNVKSAVWMADFTLSRQRRPHFLLQASVGASLSLSQSNW